MRPLLLVTLAVSVLAGTVAAQQATGTDSAAPPQGKVLVPGLQSLKIGGAYRLRFEDRLNYDFNDRIADDDDFFTQRVRLNFDAQVNDKIGAFVQLQDVRNWGEELSTTDDSADGLDLHQAYVRFGETCMGGSARVGRQVLAFGDERLVGGLEWLSQGRAFDGYRQTWQQADSYTVDFFATAVRERVPSPAYDDAWFGGVYATVDSMNDTELDFYLLFLLDEETANGGNENRSTLGVRFEHHAGPFEVGAELAAQFGEVDNADIDFGDAYAAHLHATWHFAGELKPFCRLEGNYATGNDPATAGNERFKNLFPTAHGHWGMMDFALWENMVHGMVQLGIQPGPRSKFAASFHTFESVEETDAFVGPVGRVAPAGAAAGSSNSIGSEVDLFYNVEFDTAPARTWLQLGYGMFFPGSGAKAAAGDDDSAHFFYLMTGLTF